MVRGGLHVLRSCHVLQDIERLQCHPGKSGGHVFWCLQFCYRMFPATDYLQPVTELGTPKTMAAG